MDKLAPLDDLIHEVSEMIPLGPVQLETPAGPVIYFDARFVSNGPVTLKDGSQKVTIMLVSPLEYEQGSPHLIGVIAQFNPNEARTFAATICQTADKIDGGVKN